MRLFVLFYSGSVIKTHKKEFPRASSSGSADPSLKGGVPVLTRWVFRAHKDEGPPLSHEPVLAAAKTASSNLRPRAISDISFELRHEHDLIAEQRKRIEKKTGSGKRNGSRHAEKEKL